jgi:hypothetical protein
LPKSYCPIATTPVSFPIPNPSACSLHVAPSCETITVSPSAATANICVDASYATARRYAFCTSGTVVHISPSADHASIGPDPDPVDDPEPDCEITEVPSFITADELHALLDLVDILSDGDADELERVCREIKGTVIAPVRHSTGDDFPPDVEKRWASIVARYWTFFPVLSASSPGAAAFRVAQSTIDAEYRAAMDPTG